MFPPPCDIVDPSAFVSFVNQKMSHVKKLNLLEINNATLKKQIWKENGILIRVRHMLAFTMIDSKVCNAATNTMSSMRWYICGETSKKF